MKFGDDKKYERLLEAFDELCGIRSVRRRLFHEATDKLKLGFPIYSLLTFP